MEIKLASKKELNEILNLCKEFESSPFTFDYDFINLANDRKINPIFAEKLLSSSYSITLYVKESEKIIGFITITLNPTISHIINKKIGNITLLVVKKEFRNKGYSKILIENGLNMLKKYGVTLVTVSTDIYNIPAIRSYENCGFNFQMGWHIFRHFINEKSNGKISEKIEPLENPKILNKFFFDFDRPFSLLKDKNLNRDLIKEYLFNNLITNIIKGKIKALSLKKEKKIIGVLTYQYDEISRLSISREEKVIKILDIMSITDDIKEKESIISAFLTDIKERCFDSIIIEMWVSSENQTLIKNLERNDFQLSYSGIHLHKKL